jgi:PAS domain S-box-containing protein
MTNTRLTKAQLVTEAKALRQRVAELETADVERRQAQNALQVSETRYRRLFETAQDGILILDADTGCITDVNPFLIKLLGYSYAEFLGKQLWEIGPVKDAGAARAAFLELQSNGYIRYEDLPLESRDGHRMSVEFVSNVYGVDQQQVIQCNIRDITARKWHERELESIVQMAAALRAAWTRAEMLPIIVQQAYSMSQANAAALVTLNPITGDVNVLFWQGVAVDWASLRIAPDAGVADLVIRTRQPYVNNDVGHKLQIDQPNLPGELRAIACVPLIAHDHIIGALAIGRSAAVTDEEVRLLAAASDIAATALQRAEALETFEQRVADRTHELAIANEFLLELDRLKSKFVSDVSHELRTPVTSLSLYVDLLEYGKPEKREFYVVQLKQQMGRLRMLINDILDLGHLERDRREDSLTPVNVNSIVERVTAEHQVAAGAAGLRLISEVAEQPLMVLALPDQLSRVMTNLVTNAIKYTRSGTVRVKTAATPGRICITVSDTGMGILPEDIPHIFDRFYRGKQVAQLTIPGTGLGLAIVKEIIEAHGGAVEVESRLDAGSTFRVWLPTAAAAVVDYVH